MSAGAPRPPRVREAGLAALFFLAATVAMTWPQAARLSDAMTDIWDAKLNAWILHWDWRQALSDPWNLFQATFFHPARYVLAFSENLFGVALFGFPLLAAGASPLLNYNVLLLLGMFLSALSAWALAREITGDPLASVVAGLVFAFVPWRFSQLPHVQHQWACFLCLLLLFLLRYLDGGARRDQALFGLFFAWNAIANVHYALFSGFLVAVTLLFFAIAGGSERGRRLRGALLAAFLGGLLFLPFAIPYRKAADLYGMKRYFGEMVAFSGRWTDFLSAGERNRTYGALTAKWRRAEGDFFPGVVPVALALVAVVGLRRPGQGAGAPETPSPARRRAARLLDGAVLLCGAAWIAAHARPGLRLGPVHLADPGRVPVVLSVLVLARLVVAFPGRGRYSSLGDFLRRTRLEPRVFLLLGIALAGLVVALGGNTPYYRFLFQSFGSIFQAIRAPSRGIVLFDLSLAVLASWGLALAMRGRSPAGRLAWTAAAVGLLGVEYRAFPLELHPVGAQAPPVYRWLGSVRVPGAVVEWPLGPNDAEYVFRQTAHGKPLVNGYSGFFPKPYEDLQAALAQRPIPDAVWEKMANLGASLAIYHAGGADTRRQLELARLIRRGLAAGRLQILGSFPNGADRDVVFRLTSAPRFEARVPAGSADEAARLLQRSDAEVAPPFGDIVFPEPVAVNQWFGGWALDDSGIAEVRIATELGRVANAMIGMHMPGLEEAYPDYPEKERGGFGFAIPAVPSGPHTLFITLVAKDGGETVLKRAIVVR